MKNSEDFEKAVYNKCELHRKKKRRNIAVAASFCMVFAICMPLAFHLKSFMPQNKELAGNISQTYHCGEKADNMNSDELENQETISNIDGCSTSGDTSEAMIMISINQEIYNIDKNTFNKIADFLKTATPDDISSNTLTISDADNENEYKLSGEDIDAILSIINN